jgi:hypothetical protein
MYLGPIGDKETFNWVDGLFHKFYLNARDGNFPRLKVKHLEIKLGFFEVKIFREINRNIHLFSYEKCFRDTVQNIERGSVES